LMSDIARILEKKLPRLPFDVIGNLAANRTSKCAPISQASCGEPLCTCHE
jgi:hypothetical protein